MNKKQVETVKIRLRYLVQGRDGYRGISNSWNENGDSVVKIDIEEGSQSEFSDIPKTIDGVEVQLRVVLGQIIGG